MVSAEHSNPVQAAMILDHLQRLGPITPVQALTLYGVFRLAARIHELRMMGFNIYTNTVYTDNGKHYASYVLLPQAGSSEVQDGAAV